MKEKNRKTEPLDTVVKLEMLAESLAKINYPTYITQKIRNAGLYKCVYKELSSRLINMITVDMYERKPIEYLTETGYEFLISE